VADKQSTVSHAREKSGRSFPRKRRFLLDLVGPTAFIAPTFEAGIDTARPLKSGYPSDGVIASGNHPAHGDVPEWGEGAQGYAKTTPTASGKDWSAQQAGMPWANF
jgi:hypothetical protein